MERLYSVVLETETDVFKAYVLATSVKDARQRIAGNGTVLKITDVTDAFPISEDSLARTLAGSFGEAEQKVILSLLRRHYANTTN